MAVNIFRLPKSEDPKILEAQVRQQVAPLQALRLKTLKSDPQNFFSKWEDEVDKPTEFFVDRISPQHVQHFVAIETDTVEDATTHLGYIVFINEWQEKLSPTELVCADRGDQVCVLYVAVIAVDEAWRGQGIGSRLITAALEYGRQEMQRYGFRHARVRMGVMNGNERAIKLYQRHGFVVDAPQRMEDMECDHETTMSLFIDL